MADQTATTRSTPRWAAAVDWLSLALSAIAALALLLLTVNIVADVVGRKLWNSPISGTLELSEHWWMPCATLLAFAYTERQGEHIRVTLLSDSLVPRHRAVLSVLTGGVSALMVIALMYFTLSGAVTSFELKKASTGAVSIPIWPLAFVAVVGLFALALQLLVTSARAVYESKACAPDDWTFQRSLDS